MDELQPNTEQEEQELKRQERIIEAGRVKFVDVGQALYIVKEQRLYKAKYRTFSEYCTKRWKFGEDWANRLVDTEAINRLNRQRQLELENANRSKEGGSENHVTARGTPREITPRQAKPLRGLKGEDRKKALDLAWELAGGKEPSLKHFEEAAARFKKPRKSRVPRRDQVKETVAADAATKKAAKRLVEIAQALEKLPRGGLANDKRRDDLLEEQAEIEARLGKEAEDRAQGKQRTRTEGNGKVPHAEGLTPAEIRKTIDSWLAGLSEAARNKPRPVWQVAGQIKDLF